MANKNMSGNIKRAALSMAIGAVVGLGAPARASERNGNDDGVAKTQCADAPVRTVVGRLVECGFVSNSHLINSDDNIFAYHIDTDNDGLTDRICYLIVPANMPITNIRIDTPVEIQEVRDASGIWHVSRVTEMPRLYMHVPIVMNDKAR